MRGMLWLGSTLCLMAAVAVGFVACGDRRWAGAMLALQRKLASSRIDGRRGGVTRPAHYGVRELEGLPAPVQRYFRAVLEDGQPIINAVTIDIAGTFNMSPAGAQWKPFTSRQRVVTRRPGFVWDARIRLMPGVVVRVVDSFIAGTGLLHATFQGLFTVARMQGDGEIARGEFMRWFAEAAWYPTALLPSQGVRWDVVDAHSANATIQDGTLGLTLLFRFDEAGLISSFRAEARGGMSGKTMVMAPWEGHWSNYQLRDGVRVPLTGEVAWMRSEGRRPYFVGTVTSLTFELEPGA